MASKFQNRLVGTIVLVAAGVIILPGLLDGQKQHYQDEFAAIPLVPKPGDSDEPDMLPPATQALPAQPPEGAGEEVQAGDQIPSAVTNVVTGRERAIAAVQAAMPSEPPVVEKPQPKPQPKPQTQAIQSKQLAEPAPRVDTASTTPPAGQAYMLQIGALKNADKVNEIVSSLRGAGFKVYTVPSTPVPQHPTRIIIGPEVSRDKLLSRIQEIESLSGLRLPKPLIQKFTP